MKYNFKEDSTQIRIYESIDDLIMYNVEVHCVIIFFFQ